MRCAAAPAPINGMHAEALNARGGFFLGCIVAALAAAALLAGAAGAEARPLSSAGISDTAATTSPIPFWGAIDCQTSSRVTYVGEGGDQQLTAHGEAQGNDAFTASSPSTAAPRAQAAAASMSTTSRWSAPSSRQAGDGLSGFLLPFLISDPGGESGRGIFIPVDKPRAADPGYAAVSVDRDPTRRVPQ